LEDIVRAELETFLDRVDVKGPSIFLKPSAVQSFAMVLHELATNAAKYGAFSVPQGSLSLNWYTRPGPIEKELCLHWQEKGGPPVASPRKNGLGLQLLNFSFGAHRPVIHFALEGFSLELCVPLREVC
jgi:two-component sensor histidine kinase